MFPTAGAEAQWQEGVEQGGGGEDLREIQRLGPLPGGGEEGGRVK